MMNNEAKKISEVLHELMEEKGITTDKLSYTTNIPKRFVVALKDGDLKTLPAKPYIRGYLIKISTALNADPEILLQAYKDSTEIRTSGEKDRLPTNRFAITKMNRGFLIVILIVIVIIAFVALRFKDIIGVPSVNLSLPENTLVSKEKLLDVRGTINPRDRINLNGETIYTDEGGNFKAEISLSPGLNTLEFDVKRFLGQETKITRRVFYEPQTDTNKNESE